MARNLGPVEYSEEDTYSAYEATDTPSPGGSTSLEGLTDVDISSPSDGQTLVYNAESGKWENGDSSGGSYCIDINAVPSSVTIDDVTYDRISFDNGEEYSFLIIPESVIDNNSEFYLKQTESDGANEHTNLLFPCACHYFTANPAENYPAGVALVLTVSTSTYICVAYLDSELCLIPDNAEFKTVTIPR